MAGDWIKVEHSTIEKPEVTLLSELLAIPVPHVVGLLVQFWMWMDRNSRNGDVTHVSRLSIDSVMHTPGFGAAMERVGWIKFDDLALAVSVPNFDRHNGNPAKSRALGARRQSRHRNGDVTHHRDISVTREEKRRDTPIVPDGFAEFWLAYPRKVAKAAAMRSWRKLALAPDLQAKILADLRSMHHGGWDDARFIPHPASYLNGRRWEDENAPARPAKRGVAL